MSDEPSDNFEGFGSKAVHSGTKHVGDAVNTPIFQSSTYKLTDERYAGWAAGAHHTLLYARITSVNAEAVAAVTVPSKSKAGFNLFNLSILLFGLIFPSTSQLLIPIISFLKFP